MSVSDRKFIPVYKVEELLRGKPIYLSILIYKLVERGFYHKAIGVCQRNNFEISFFASQFSEFKVLEAIEYDPSHDEKP